MIVLLSFVFTHSRQIVECELIHADVFST